MGRVPETFDKVMNGVPYTGGQEMGNVGAHGSLAVWRGVRHGGLTWVVQSIIIFSKKIIDYFNQMLTCLPVMQCFARSGKS